VNTLTQYYWAWRKRLSQRISNFRTRHQRVLDPLFLLFYLALILLLFYSAFHLQANPQWLQQARLQFHKSPLPDYLTKLKTLAALTTQNAEYTVLRDNMERLRLMLEAYPVEGSGYPGSIDELYAHASERDFWILYTNPLTRSFGQREGIVADYNAYLYSADRSSYKGMVLYEPIGVYAYRIYACDQDGELVENKDGVFTLSNLE